MVGLQDLERCPGCGGLFKASHGPVHRYLASSAGCWETFGHILAREYSEPELMLTHRLTVDTYAVQHPGDGSRRAIQSVGIHLARLMMQMEDAQAAVDTNGAMLAIMEHKALLPALTPPVSFAVTAADIALPGSAEEHRTAIREWARATWMDWSDCHAFIRRWVESRR